MLIFLYRLILVCYYGLMFLYCYMCWKRFHFSFLFMFMHRLIYCFFEYQKCVSASLCFFIMVCCWGEKEKKLKSNWARRNLLYGLKVIGCCICYIILMIVIFWSFFNGWLYIICILMKKSLPFSYCSKC